MARGSRRRRHLHVRDALDPGRHLRREGHDRPQLGRELRRRRAPQRPEHLVLGHRTEPARPLHLQLDDPPTDDPGGPRERQQRRMGRPRLRLARHALQVTGGRGPGGDARGGPLPDLPQRRHRRDAS